jgi:hypothetical protein
VLEQLAVMRFLMDGHERCLALSCLVWRLPRRRLPVQGYDKGEECNQAKGRDNDTRHDDTSLMFR